MSSPRLPLLLGHFGGSNAGDEAILDGTCHLLAANGSTKVRVVTRSHAPTTSSPVALEAVPPAAFAVLRAVLSSSVVVLAGGTHFHDDYQRRRRYRHYRYLMRFLAILALARLAGRPVVALGQGVGPLEHLGGRLLGASVVFLLVPAGTVRDDASLRCAQLVGAGRNWQRTFDTAAAAPGRWCDPDAPRTTIAVAPVFGVDRALWTACIGAIAATWDTTARAITVLGFRGGDREDDGRLVAEIAHALTIVAPTSEIVFDDNGADVTEALSGASIVLCARYHALVLGLLAGAVPIVLPAHRKLVDTARLVGLPVQLIVRDMSVDAIASALEFAREFDPRKLQPVLEDLRADLDDDAALLARLGALG